MKIKDLMEDSSKKMPHLYLDMDGVQADFFGAIPWASFLTGARDFLAANCIAFLNSDFVSEERTAISSLSPVKSKFIITHLRGVL